MTGIAVAPHDPKRVVVTGDMLGIGLSVDGGKTWGPTFGLPTYEIGAPTWHPTNPKVVWAGTVNGPAVSADGGRTCEIRRGGFPPVPGWGIGVPIQKILFNPTDPTRLIAVNGSSRRWPAYNGEVARWGEVWESRDAKTWTKIGQIGDPAAKTNEFGSGRNVVAAEFAAGSGKRIYALADSAGVWRSDDGGKRWSRVGTTLPTDDVRRLQVHPTNPNVLWISTGSGKVGPDGKRIAGSVYRSDDAGATFVPLANGLARRREEGPMQTSRYDGLAVSPKDPNVMVTGDSAWNAGVLYVTRDGGKNWRPTVTKSNVGVEGLAAKNVQILETAMPAGLGASVIAIDPSNPDKVFAVNSEWIVATENGGKSWADVSSVKNPDGTWTGTGYAGWCATAVRFDPWTKNRLAIQAMDAARAWVSTDGGKGWRYGEGFPQPWNGGNDLAWARGGKAWATFGQHGSFGGVGFTEDAGRNWKVLSGNGLPELDARDRQPGAIATLPDDPTKVWVSVAGKTLRSENGRDFAPENGAPDGVNAFLLRAPVLYAGTNGGLWRREAGGDWRFLGGPKPVTRLASAADGTLWMTSKEGDRSGVWTLKDGVWTRRLDEFLAMGIACDPADPRRVVVTTSEDNYKEVDPSTGVWATSDGGKTWGRANDGLAMLRANTVAFDPFDSTSLVLGTYGRGFYRGVWPKSAELAADRTYAPSPEDAAYAAPTDWKDQPAVSLRNGGFDKDVAEWSDKWTERGDLKAVWDPNGREGGALRVETVGDAKGQLSQMHPGRDGQKFRLVGWVRSSGNVKVNVAVTGRNEGYAPIDFQQAAYAQNESDWTAFDKTIVLPPGSRHFSVVVFLEGTGKAWVDGLRALPVR